MRGIIFRTYLNFIQDNFGYATIDEILLKNTYPNKGGFSAAGNYKSSYLVSLVSNSKYLFGNSADNVLKAFGKYAFKFLLNRFKATYEGSKTPLHVENAFDFLDNLNIIHFDELHKLYPDAKFPKFDIQRDGVNKIVIDYSSHRNLPYLVYGLIEGCLEYFSENASLTMTKTPYTKTIKGEEWPVYRFEVSGNA